MTGVTPSSSSGRGCSRLVLSWTKKKKPTLVSGALLVMAGVSSTSYSGRGCYRFVHSWTTPKNKIGLSHQYLPLKEGILQAGAFLIKWRKAYVVSKAGTTWGDQSDMQSVHLYSLRKLISFNIDNFRRTLPSWIQPSFPSATNPCINTKEIFSIHWLMS
jgi:hypothetical protein